MSKESKRKGWNYRLIYSKKHKNLAIHQYYYSVQGYKASPYTAQVYDDEEENRTTLSSIKESIYLIKLALDQPIIVFEDKDNPTQDELDKVLEEEE